MAVEKFFGRAQLRADFLAFEEIENVTVAVPGDGSNDSPEWATPVAAKAFRRTPSFRQGNPVAGIDMVFHIDAGGNTGTPLKVTPLSKIIDSTGSVYQVQNADLQSFETRWRCSCTRLLGPEPSVVSSGTPIGLLLVLTR